RRLRLQRRQRLLERHERQGPVRREEEEVHLADGGHQMSPTYKVLSLLLSYPGEAIGSAAEELKLALREDKALPPGIRRRLEGMIDGMAGADLYELQEDYVLLFDRTRSLSLNLFEHVHGESRDRGQAMVDLLATYEAHGLRLTARELPDHLPLFLEFLSTLPAADAREY